MIQFNYFLWFEARVIYALSLREKEKIRLCGSILFRDLF